MEDKQLLRLLSGDIFPYAHVVHPPEPFSYNYVYNIGESADRRKHNSFDPSCTTYSTIHFIFDDVLFDPARSTVLQRKNWQAWSMYGFAHSGETAEIFPRAATAHHLDGRVAFCGFHRHWRNPSHWITECIPAISSYSSLISSYAENGLDPIIILPSRLDSRKLRAIELTGTDLNLIKYIDPDEVFSIEKLVISSLICCTGSPSPFCGAPSPFCASVFTQMSERANSQNLCIEPQGGLYVSRLDGAARQMLNESELVRRLKNKGIESVLLSSDLSMDEVIMKFRSKKLIIGAHGAGMGNIVFCQPGSVIYELFPEHFVHPYAAILSHQTGLHYWADAYPAHEPFRLGYSGSWSIDLDFLENRLAEIAGVHGLDFL